MKNRPGGVNQISPKHPCGGWGEKPTGPGEAFLIFTVHRFRDGDTIEVMKHDRDMRPGISRMAGRGEGEHHAAAESRAGGDPAEARPVISGLIINGRAASEETTCQAAARRKTKASPAIRYHTPPGWPFAALRLSVVYLSCDSVHPDES